MYEGLYKNDKYLHKKYKILLPPKKKQQTKKP